MNFQELSIEDPSCDIPDCDNKEIDDYDGHGHYCSWECAAKHNVFYCTDCENYEGGGVFYSTPWSCPAYCCEYCLQNKYSERFSLPDDHADKLNENDFKEIKKAHFLQLYN